MNQGMVCGVVKNSNTGAAVSRALVAVNHIETASERGGRLRVFNANGFETGNLFTETGSDGSFVLNFGWDALDLGNVQSVPPVCHLNIGDPRTTGATVVSYHFSRRHRTLSRAVSLGAIANGTIPNPASVPDCVGMAMDVYQLVRGIRLPMIGRTFMGPSAEALALLGFFRFNI